MDHNDGHGPRPGVGALVRDTPSASWSWPFLAGIAARCHTCVHGKEHAMRRALIILVGTGIAAIPAAMGLVGNASFAERLPVNVPVTVSTSSPHAGAGDDRDGLRVTRTAEPGDDRGGATRGSDESATHDAGDDHGGTRGGGSDDPATHDAGDDHGGTRGGGSDDPATHDAGDDQGAAPAPEAASGSDDPATHDAGDDHGGSGKGSGGPRIRRLSSVPTTADDPVPASAGAGSALRWVGPCLALAKRASAKSLGSGGRGGSSPARRAGADGARRGRGARHAGGQRLAEREAVNDAARMPTCSRGRRPAGPHRRPGRRGPAALQAIDALVRQRVLGPDVVRVKLWSPQGDPVRRRAPLIGRTFALSAEQRTSSAHRDAGRGLSTSTQAENQFETGDRLLEVYRPVWSPNGPVDLFEIYAPYDAVGDRDRPARAAASPA